MPSSDGLRNLATSRPESACSLSRDGEGLSDLDGVVVGKGSLEAGRGIPLGRVGVLGCLSIAITFVAFQRSIIAAWIGSGGSWARDQGETTQKIVGSEQMQTKKLASGTIPRGAYAKRAKLIQAATCPHLRH